MAGYLGTKAVFLSTTAASVGGDATIGGDLTIGSNALFVDESAGNVGIGTSSPSEELHIYKNTTNSVDLKLENSEGSATLKANNDSFYIDADNHVFRSEASSERMRIDSSGNLLVGKTSANTSIDGFEVLSTGRGSFRRSGGTTLFLDRVGTDGTILSFRKDGSTVGSISFETAGFSIDGESNHTGIQFGAIAWVPRDNGVNVDNAVDLGFTSGRFDDIYATNTVIQTSDQNEKQQIASLTTAEITAAKAISQLFKTFKWNDSVADKGDAARTHTGVIAQEVETAITDAGLDAGDYAFFISGTWWETQTDVPAVAAVAAADATYDDDGNELTPAVEAVEAKDAYTRTDTYQTLADAPAGATERTRKGIRYPELLSFVGAATEQRLADIETRLAALEAN